MEFRRRFLQVGQRVNRRGAANHQAGLAVDGRSRGPDTAGVTDFGLDLFIPVLEPQHAGGDARSQPVGEPAAGNMIGQVEGIGRAGRGIEIDARAGLETFPPAAALRRQGGFRLLPQFPVLPVNGVGLGNHQRRQKNREPLCYPLRPAGHVLPDLVQQGQGKGA